MKLVQKYAINKKNLQSNLPVKFTYSFWQIWLEVNCRFSINSIFLGQFHFFCTSLYLLISFENKLDNENVAKTTHFNILLEIAFLPLIWKLLWFFSIITMGQLFCIFNPEKFIRIYDIIWQISDTFLPKFLINLSGFKNAYELTQLLYRTQVFHIRFHDYTFGAYFYTCTI